MKKVALCISKGGETYKAALEQAGIKPLMFPHGPLDAKKFTEVTGLMLVGGEDIDPRLYGQAPGPNTETVNPDRDKFELEVLKRAYERHLSIFAICRGMQMLNIFLGGSLVQHLPTAARHRVKLEDKALSVHQVVINPDSQLAGMLGQTLIDVNSRHHQGLDRIGAGLRVAGRCPDDNVVEAVEASDRKFVVGVQWHPENMVGTSEHAKRLFKSLEGAL